MYTIEPESNLQAGKLWFCTFTEARIQQDSFAECCSTSCLEVTERSDESMSLVNVIMSIQEFQHNPTVLTVRFLWPGLEIVFQDLKVRCLI